MIKIEVPYLDQSHYYPTGCESVSTVMLLQYLTGVSVDEFIRDYLGRIHLKNAGVIYMDRIRDIVFVEVPMMRNPMDAMLRSSWSL